MRNDEHARADTDYTAYLVRERSDSPDDACDGTGAREQASGDDSLCFAPETASTDYFVFYQEDGRWFWRRVNESETIVEVCHGSFRYYLHASADARRHGWNGKPLFLLSSSGFSNGYDL